MRIAAFLLLPGLLLGCSDADQTDADAAGRVPPLTAEVIAANNRGVGLMGYFDYPGAYQVFAELARQYPEQAELQFNLAIATLNRQQPGDEQQTLDILGDVLASDSDNLRAHYLSGLVLLYLGKTEVAARHFRRVIEADPDDAYAAYFLAQCLAQQGEFEQALVGYQRVVEIDSYLRSAYYGAFMAAQRLGRREQARAYLDDYQRLESNPQARLAEFKYTRMGPRAEALAIGVDDPEPTPRPQGEFFQAPVLLAEQVLPDVPVAGITLADLQSDDLLDVFVAGGGAANVLLAGGDGGDFAAMSDHPLRAIDRVNSALWGDYDNDGATDVYLLRNGPNQLWRNLGDGGWEDVTAAAGIDGGILNTVDGAFFDADHDGDLDVFLVNADGPNELLNNNLDGSFRAIATEQDIAGDGRASRAVLIADLERDRDADIIVLNETPPHEVYINDRLWRYHSPAGFEQFKMTPMSAVVAGDIDADGALEIYARQADGSVLSWTRNGDLNWTPRTLGQPAAAVAKREQLALLDISGDGRQELVLSTDMGWSVYGFSADGLQTLFQAKPADGLAIVHWTPAVLDAAAGPSVIALRDDGALLLWSPGPGRHRFLALRFTGLDKQADSMRSNASGIGTGAAVRVGSRWRVIDTFRPDAGPGQSLQPVAVGLSSAERLDFIAINWSDGVFQSELGLRAGELHQITETQRQLSSCPILFAWDGERFRFVSDILAVGGLGYSVAPGFYATPRPRENFLLPPGLLQPLDGRYQLKIGEPMEETLYLDSARLLVYDLPPGWRLGVDERLAINDPQPTGQAFYYRDWVVPQRALNERGEDVTKTLLAIDHSAAPVGALDRRFIGRLQGEHVLTLSFAEPLDDKPGRPVLLIDGWGRYPYSQTSIAAWQAGADYRAPTLDVRTQDGDWQTLYPQFGYPVVMPRQIALPLDELPAGIVALRLRTNMEIYWDRIAVAYAAEPLSGVRRYVLNPVAARTAQVGFARRSTGAQQLPDYDYQQRAPFWDARTLRGLYTRLGAALELVAAHDDAVAIVGSGEEVHLKFTVPERPPAYWNRYFVLESRGWAKDMDIYTRDGETVGPLPSSGKPALQRDLLHKRYNTRFESGF